MGLHFAVLGTLEVRAEDGSEIRLGGTVRRQVLAALLCRAGRTVAPEALIEDVWGELAPRSAAKTLQSHIVRLRDDLGRGDELRTEPGGYLLAADVDARRFEELLRELPDDTDHALARLADALALWRGDAYLDFGDAAFAVGERLRLAELRHGAIERHTDLALGAGRAAALVSDLEARVAREPYRERGWEQLMLALYRTGRQADALGAFRRARDVLGADLGVDPGPGLRELEGRILHQDGSLLAGTPVRDPVRATVPGRCPYPGLAGYGESDTTLFVGRERLVAELAGRIAEERLVVVTGPSGSGKSSLVHAGLLPALRAGAVPGSAAWRTTVCTASTVGAAKPADLLVVDQAEELFTLIDGAERASAGQLLLGLIADGVRVVLVLRGDFFDRLAELDRLAALARTTVLVRSMRDDELRRAIVEPAATCGYGIEPAMLDAALDEVSGRPGALPLLSAALVRAWRNRDGATLTLDGYRRGGGIAGALEAGAEEAWTSLPDGVRPSARRLLLRLAATSGGDWARRPIALDDLGADEDAMARLTASRLLSVAGGRVEIVHEALLQRWPRLRDWLAERALGADLLDHLAGAARAWDLDARPSADLYRGARLQSALTWAGEHPEDLAPVETDFLAASEDAADAELVETRHRADREAKGRRRLRVLVAGLVAVLAVAVLVGIVAVRSQRAASRSSARAAAAALTADARRLAAESLSAPDLRTALLLAVAGYRLQPSADTRSALLTTIEKNGSALWRISTAQRVQWVGASADGSQLWESDNLSEVTRYDTRTRRVLSSFNIGGARSQSVSPDGRLFAVSGGSQDTGPGITGGTVRVLDAHTGQLVRTLAVPTIDGPFTWHTAAFTGDGRWLVVLESTKPDGATEGRDVAIYDARALGRAPRVLHLDAPVTGLAVARTSFAVATDERQVEIIAADDLRVLRRGTRPDLLGKVDPSDTGGDVLALTPDASALAYLDRSGDVHAVRADRLDGGPALSLDVGPGPWQAIGFSPSGKELAAGALAGTVAVASVATGRPVQDLAGHSGPVMGLDWAPGSGSTELYTGGLDSQLVSWDLSTGARMLHLSGSIRPTGEYGVVGPRLVGFYPVQPGDGGTAHLGAIRLLATDLATGRTQTWPLGLSGDDYIADDSRDARARYALLTIVTSSTASRCELRDLGDGHVVHTFLEHYSDTVSGYCVLSRDGSTAVVADGQHTLTTYRLPSFTRTGSITVLPRGTAAKRIIDIPLGFTPGGLLVVWGADPGTQGPSAVVGNQLLDLVDPHSGAIVGQADLGPNGQPQALNYSPDGSRLLIATNAGEISMYSATDLRPIVTGVPAADGFVFAATFAPDGTTVVTTGSDGTMRFFDGTTLQPVGVPIHLPADDWAFAGFGAGGDLVAGVAAVAVGKEQYFTFPGDPSVWSSTACDIAGSELTPAEWARYVGDRPYTKVCAAS